MSYSTSERIASTYGVDQTNPIADNYNFDRDTITLRELADRRGHVTRVRILQEYNRCDVSYVHGVTGDGEDVRLYINSDSMLVPRRELKGNFIEWAKREGVFAKGIGLLDEGNWSVQKA